MLVGDGEPLQEPGGQQASDVDEEAARGVLSGLLPALCECEIIVIFVYQVIPLAVGGRVRIALRVGAAGRSRHGRLTTVARTSGGEIESFRVCIGKRRMGSNIYDEVSLSVSRTGWFPYPNADQNPVRGTRQQSM